MSGGGSEGAVDYSPLTHIATTRFIKQDFPSCTILTSDITPRIVVLTEATKLDKKAEIMKILWHADPFLGNDRETNKTTAIARQQYWSCC
jgi:hypothetical protein